VDGEVSSVDGGVDCLMQAAVWCWRKGVRRVGQTRALHADAGQTKRRYAGDSVTMILV
jgi:hypothetical protein